MNVTSAMEDLASRRPDLWGLSGVGVTRSETIIWALLDRDAYARHGTRPRVLLVSGLSDSDETVALEVLQRWTDQDKPPISLSAVPVANPDAVELGTGGYPPEGGFYDDHDRPEQRYLWRWTCLLAPDLVVELQTGDEASWESNESAAWLAPSLRTTPIASPDSFVGALGLGTPEGIGVVPGVRLTVAPHRASEELDRLWSSLTGLDVAPSAARVELDRRRARSSIETGRVLASVYGRTLEPVVYTQGVAISGRLRLAALDGDSPSPIAEISELVEPFADPAVAYRDGPTVGVAENFAAFVWADEFASATGDRRFADLLVQAADRYTPGTKGEAPRPARANFPTEDVFFTSAILGRGFSLTGKSAHIDILADFLVDAKIQQDKGLFLHSRTGPFHWGRANGFAALGLTETLTYMPDDHPKREAIVSMLSRQMTAAQEFQEPSGMVRQVVDFPGSYQEFTATSMIGYAIARGLRLGWLDPSFRETVDLAWRGISERIDGQGGIIDACTGTGNGETLRHYLDRPALTGEDDRSGSMALWFAAEMERLRRQSPVRYA